MRILVRSFWISLTVLLMSLAGSADAAWYQGVVTSVMADGGIVRVFVDTGYGQSSCGNGQLFWLDPTVAYDKSMMALAVSARMSGKLVWISGDDSCNAAWPYNNGHRLGAIDLKG